MVTFRYGLFSHLWIDMMQRMGLEVVVIEGRWGDGADEAKLEAILREDKEKKIKAVCVVQVGGSEQKVNNRDTCFDTCWNTIFLRLFLATKERGAEERVLEGTADTESVY